MLDPNSGEFDNSRKSGGHGDSGQSGDSGGFIDSGDFRICGESDDSDGHCICHI